MADDAATEHGSFSADGVAIIGLVKVVRRSTQVGPSCCYGTDCWPHAVPKAKTGVHGTAATSARTQSCFRRTYYFGAETAASIRCVA